MKFLFQRIEQETVVVEADDSTEAYITAVSGKGTHLGDCNIMYHPSYQGGFGGLVPMPQLSVDRSGDRITLPDQEAPG